MPLYDYKCENGHRFEVRQNIRDDALKTCIECEAPARRVIHPVGIVFKGSGFYATDSRKQAASGADGSSENGGKKNADGADGKDGKKDAGGEKTAAGAGGEKTAASVGGEKTAARASSEGSTAKAGASAASNSGAGSPAGGSSDSKSS